METIVILSRGMRIAPIFAEIARDLSKKYKIIVATGIGKQTPAELEAACWTGLPNTTIYDLPKENAKRYQYYKDLSSDQRIEKIRAVEKEIGVTAYQASCNFLIYRRFSKDYYKHWDGYVSSENEIAEEFIGSYVFFKEIFDAHKPVLVFCETIDLASHRIANALAHVRNIFTLEIAFVTAFEKGKAFFAAGSNRWNPVLEHYYKNPHLISDENKEKAKVLLEQSKLGAVVDAEHIKKYRQQSKQNPLISRLNKLKTAKKINPKGLAKRELSRLTNYSWLNRHFKHELPKEPYVLVSLHHQPEAATSLLAPRWVDQNMIVEQLSIHAPYGLKIVVKENPRTYGLRGKRYFEPLNDLPNVHLLHPTFDNQLSIKNAEALVVISGTVGFEGLLMRKRVAALSNTYYTLFPGVRVLDHPSDLFSVLGSEWDPAHYEKELNLFAAAFIQSLFYLGRGAGGVPWPEPKEAGPNFAKAIEEFLAFSRKENIKPNDFRITL